MSDNVTLRLARRLDSSELARITNAANAKSAAHRRVAPDQDKFPLDYYQWRLNIVRQRFAVPNLRTIVAEESTSGRILGLASWTVEGPNTALYKRWVGESTWFDWLESKLIEVESIWLQWTRDKSIDYEFMKSFTAAFEKTDYVRRPACLHLTVVSVDPSRHSRGVGRMLVDWGKELATREGLPLFLTANLEATGFYEKGGFARMSKDVVVSPEGEEPVRIPVYVWEGQQREGRWLERDESFVGVEERWRWRSDVLSIPK